MTMPERMARAVAAVPVWVGLLDSTGREPADGYTRIPVGMWTVDGDAAETDVVFTAGRDWGTIVQMFLADADGVIWRRIEVPRINPRAGDTVAAVVTFEVEAA